MAYSGLWGTSGATGVPGQLGEPGKAQTTGSKQSVLGGGNSRFKAQGTAGIVYSRTY